MKVTQEKLPASQIGLEIEIPAETTKNVYEKVVQNLARSANIPGFRKGKVPRQILLQRLGAQQIKKAALEELIQDSFKQAVEQAAIEPIGNYKLRSSFEELVQKYQPGEPVTFSASVDVRPEVTLGDYQNLSVKAEETAYDSSQVDNFLEQRREQQATLVPVERLAQRGDVAVIDYQARLAEGNTELPDIQAADFQVELSEGKFIPGFVEGIVDMSLEETKEVSVTFPEDYPQEDLAGKPVIFSIVLKELKEKELPELDDDFAEEVSEFATIDELRESLESQFKEKAQRETRNSVHQAIVEELLKQSSIELPETLLENEVDTILTQTAVQMQNYGMDVKQMFTADTIPQMRERARPEATERLKQTLIIKEIARRESIQPEPEAIESRIKEVTEQLTRQDYDPERLREVVQEQLLEEKTLDWLQEKATVEIVPLGSLNPSDDQLESTTDEAIEPDVPEEAQLEELGN